MDPAPAPGEIEDLLRDDEEAPAARDASVSVSLPRLAWLIVRHPGRAMANLAQFPGRRWFVPILLLALVSAAAAAVSAPKIQAEARAQVAAQMERAAGDAEVPQAQQDTVNQALRITSLVGVVASLFTPFIGILVLAAILHFLATVLGGQQSFSQMLAVTSWAKVPLILQAVLRLAYALTGGFDARPNGLMGLVPKASLLGPVLAPVSLWNLWSLALLVVAVAAASRMSRGKALGVVAAVVLLQVAVGEAGVALTNVFAGMGGQ